jgi:cysteine desulfurase|tara:strand:+ start:175 stop:1314 length:1140 start_codon:yes stop_codon:yes gene_type:complete
MIYLDHNATTAPHPEVIEVMMPFISSQQGNPASNHSYGRRAHTAIEDARGKVAEAVNAHPSQVIFTASGTESNNTIINGIARSYPNTHFAYSAIEHPCISKPIEAIKKLGFKATEVPVTNMGLIDFTNLSQDELASISFLSIMMANNETGVIQDMVKINRWAKDNDIILHTDAVQALGKLNVDFDCLGVDAMTISSHKIYGPQGVAALILNKKIDLHPHLLGGGQEKGLRSGTENIAAIIGFGKACELSQKNVVRFGEEVKILQSKLENALIKMGAIIFGKDSNRLSNTTFFSFKDIDGSTLLTALDRKGFAVASGSACSSNSGEPSHVLLAMNVDEEQAKSALRVSLGVETTREQIDDFIKALRQELERLKQLTAVAA